MTKKVIKEGFILLLLSIALLIVLAIVFYEYVPINKVVSEPVQYSMPKELSDIKEELNTSFSDSSEDLVVSYSIEPEDLVSFKKTKEYEAGKANPFEVYVEEEPENTEETTKSSLTINGKPVEKNTNESKNTRRK